MECVNRLINIAHPHFYHYDIRLFHTNIKYIRAILIFYIRFLTFSKRGVEHTSRRPP